MGEVLPNHEEILNGRAPVRDAHHLPESGGYGLDQAARQPLMRRFVSKTKDKPAFERQWYVPFFPLRPSVGRGVQLSAPSWITLRMSTYAKSAALESREADRYRCGRVAR